MWPVEEIREKHHWSRWHSLSWISLTGFCSISPFPIEPWSWHFYFCYSLLVSFRGTSSSLLSEHQAWNSPSALPGTLNHWFFPQLKSTKPRSQLQCLFYKETIPNNSVGSPTTPHLSIIINIPYYSYSIILGKNWTRWSLQIKMILLRIVLPSKRDKVVWS